MCASSAGRSRKALFSAYMGYVSIYRRTVLHPNLQNQMRIPLVGQRSHWALDGVLIPLLNIALKLSNRFPIKVGKGHNGIQLDIGVTPGQSGAD